MKICEHCGARVYGDICEYCDMPVKNTAPEIKYKSGKPLIIHKKTFLRAVIAGAASVFAVSMVTLFVSVNHHNSRTYIQNPATEHNMEYNNDGYLLEEAIPVYDEERPVYDPNEILSETGIFPEGTYQIGVDIPEGLYLFVPDMADGRGVEGVYSDPECENQISSAYVHFDGSRIAELSGNGYVEFSWATAYNLDMHPEIVNDPFSHDGMFIVGRDIPAGTYNLIPYGEFGEYGEWYIYSCINAVGAVPKSSGVINEGDGYNDNVVSKITLNDGEIFELRDCVINS